MISRAQITRRASEDGVDARVVERDYVLAHVVALIATHDAHGALVFKGGASLRLLHFDEYRYSADLDYSLARGSETEAHEVIRGAFSQPRSGGYHGARARRGTAPHQLHRASRCEEDDQARHRR